MPDPTPAPEWAVKMAQKLSADFTQSVVDLCNRNEALTVGADGVWGQMLARLLASVRDAALWEAADAVVDNVVRSFDAERAILALIGTAPKEADRG